MRSELGLLVAAFLVCGALLGAEGNLMLQAAAQSRFISLDEALRLALARNEDLKKAELAVDIAQGTMLQSASKLLPRISAKATHANDEGAAKKESTLMGISASAPLLDARGLMDMKSKRELVVSSKDKFVSERDTLIHDVGLLYIEAFIAEAIAENSKQEWEVAKAQQSIFERKSKVGQARNLDVRRAQYLAAKAHTDYLFKVQDFQGKMGELGAKIGENEFFQLQSVTITSEHFKKPPANLVDMAMAAADVKALRKEIAAADSVVISEKFDFIPKLTASLDGGWLAHSVDNRIERPFDPFSVKVMLNLELPLFSGGGSLAAIKSATAKRATLQLDLRVRQTEKALSINGLVAELESLEIIAANAQIAVESASLAKESADRLFERSEATGLEVSEANANLFSAKNLLMNAQLRREQAKLKLLLVIGAVGDLVR